MHSHVRAQACSCPETPSTCLSYMHVNVFQPGGRVEGVSHNSAVAWDKAKFKRGKRHVFVAQGSQISRKSQLFRDTLVLPVSAVRMESLFNAALHPYYNKLYHKKSF